MKILKRISLLLLLLNFSSVIAMSQQNVGMPERTPEQEAASQTEKMQRELNLNEKQAKEIFDINLKYAKERQVNKTRSAAVERIRNKDRDVRKVLNREQYERLQYKKSERSTVTNGDRISTSPQRSTEIQAPVRIRSERNSLRTPAPSTGTREKQPKTGERR